MAIDKSKWNTSVKVSQKTINEIKKMGMSGALKSVAGAQKASKDDASARAFVEGVRRLYGADRVAAATKSTSAVKYSSADAARSASKPKATPKPASTPIERGRVAVEKANKTKASTSKTSTTSNPFTALHNAVSPYGNKNQKFKSPISSSGAATRKAVPGKPSVGESINSFFSSLGKHQSAADVEKEMARRAGVTVAQYRAGNKNKK